MTDVLTLIDQKRGVDQYGDPTVSEDRREVFCSCSSIGQKEFYQAQAVGLQPEIKFTLQDYYDYEGEMYAEHEGIRYKIIRTYSADQKIELVCTREVNDHVGT
jgi:SPP1 family predicted phage head-tail adaptor